MRQVASAILLKPGKPTGVPMLTTKPQHAVEAEACQGLTRRTSLRAMQLSREHSMVPSKQGWQGCPASANPKQRHSPQQVCLQTVLARIAEWQGGLTDAMNVPRPDQRRVQAQTEASCTAHLQNFTAPYVVRQGDLDDPVKAPRPDQRQVQHIYSVGGSHHDDVVAALKAIHAGQQHVERGIALIVALVPTALAADGIDLINEDDRRGCILGLQTGGLVVAWATQGRRYGPMPQSQCIPGLQAVRSRTVAHELECRGSRPPRTDDRRHQSV